MLMHAERTLHTKWAVVAAVLALTTWANHQVDPRLALVMPALATFVVVLALIVRTARLRRRRSETVAIFAATVFLLAAVLADVPASASMAMVGTALFGGFTLVGLAAWREVLGFAGGWRVALDGAAMVALALLASVIAQSPLL